MEKRIQYFRETFKEILSLGNEFKSFPESDLYEALSYAECEALVENNKAVVRTMREAREELLGRLHTIPDVEKDLMNKPVDAGEDIGSLGVSIHVTDFVSNELEEQIAILERWRASL